MSLIEMAICFRAMQLYTHHAHNLVAHATFFSDHEFFGELYSFAEGAYDSLIERHVGTVSDQINLAEVVAKAHQKIVSLQSTVKENKTYYLETLKLVDYILAECEKYKSAPVSIGTQNLIADLADKTEVIKFKIKQRVK